MAQGCSEPNEEFGEGCRAAGEAMCGGDALPRAGEVIRALCGRAGGVSEGISERNFNMMEKVLVNVKDLTKTATTIADKI